MAYDAKGRQPIRAGNHARGEIGRAHSVSSDIGALIVKEDSVHCQQPAVRVDCGADAVQLLARVTGRDKVLASVFDPLNWVA